VALNNLGLGFVFTAHDLASAKMQGLERNFMSLDRKVGLGTDRITGSFRELGIGLSIMTAGAAMVGGAFALADKAGQFEQAIAAVAAVSGATKDELAQLRDAESSARGCFARCNARAGSTTMSPCWCSGRPAPV